jgi:hypothetical protein
MTSLLPNLRLSLLLLTAACAGADSATEPAGPPPSADSRLVGQATAPAVPVIPDKLFVPRSEDYTIGSLELPGARVSFNTVLVGIRPTATVGSVNTLLQQVGATIVGGLPGTPNGAGGVLALRLTTTTHAAMRTALTTLRAAPEVLLAVSDIVVDVNRVTKDGSDDAGWLWTITGEPINPAFGTWGVAAIRMPQTWNLNARITASGASVPTGVLDDGFDPVQEDLRNMRGFVGIERIRTHGTQVSSIIAAKFDNDKGMDGVNPFASLVFGSTPSLSVDDATMTTGAVAWGLFALLDAHPELRVVNVSLGYNWHLFVPSVSTTTSAEARARANDDAALLDLFLQSIEERQPLPVIVAAAGNDHGDSAQYSSMFANASLRRNVAAIVVVEADSAMGSGASLRFQRSQFSNIGGHLSAPGSRVATALNGSQRYARGSGTSFAAPFVSGLVGFLIALEPELPRPTRRVNVIRDILIRTINTSADRIGVKQVDAFAAALELDVQTGSDRVLRRLLDVDDGTQDGNTRIDPFTKAVVLTDDVMAETLINMGDFRRWRDGMLRLDFPGLTNLDGADDHPKKDLNGDRRFSSATEENIFPFADFNGDGELSQTAKVKMAGVLAPRGPMTDLQVLQSRFADPDYEPGELDALIASGDLHVRTRGCVPAAGERVGVRVSNSSGGFVKSHVFAAGDSQYVFTVPVRGAPAEYVVRTSRLDPAGTELIGRDTTVIVALGADATSAGGCAQAVVASVTVTPGSLTLPVAGTQSFTAVAREANGAVITGRIVTWSSSNDAIASASTAAPTSGTATVRGNAAGTAVIRARVSGVQGTATVTVTAASTGPRITSTTINVPVINTIGAVTPVAMQATGGTAPYTWQLAPGAAFVNPITLSADGIIRGQCLTCLTFPNNLFFQKGNFIDEPLVLITVRDANGRTITMEVLLRFYRGA